MSPLFDLYQPGDSWLHRLDPRVKLLLAICGCILLLLLRNLVVMVVALLLAHVALVSAGFRRDRLGWVWRMTSPTMVMIAVLWVLFYPGEGKPLLAWWIIRITPQNLAEGSAIALRIGTLAFIAFVWLFSTDQATLVRSFVALGMPFEWGLVLAMALRYLPTMANLFRMISDAQQARALVLDRGSPLKRARAYIPITVAMLIAALRTAQNLAHALESRALGATPHRTFRRQLHFRAPDLAWTVGIALTTALLLWARFALGFGTDPLRLW